MIDSNEWIECRPEVMRGKPCIKGTRITVESILEMLSSGMSYAEIISDFPSLNEIKIRAALGYAANNLSKGDAA
ncbi:MAG: DUF433 domain-containing protein [Endozoicomonas sp.]|uniref:DUF433 domain-containing protein n=1 Tax=Endozoicomonas sp. TaxID=1892382 RepID=UPI003D9B28B7